MLFNINYENFLLHFIDYFEPEEILTFNFIILSSKMRNNDNKEETVKKAYEFYPSSELCERYDSLRDIEVFRREYFDELKQYKERLWSSVVSPILHHRHNFMFINMRFEDVYTQSLTEYIYQTFRLRCINLNDLFEKGETDIFYIDKRAIKSQGKEIALESTRKMMYNKEKTEEGRLEIIAAMDKHAMIKKLKELEINHKGLNESEMKSLLISEWAEDNS